MLIKSLISSVRKRKKDKEEAAVYNDIQIAVSMMLTNLSNSPDIASHIRKASEQEVGQIINGAKSLPSSTPGKGYYIPSLQNYVVHSLETWPDRVYFFKHLDLHEVQTEDVIEERISSLWVSPLPIEYMNKDLFVFYYNSFGFSETHLCARVGYVFYDAEENQIVACAWRGIS